MTLLQAIILGIVQGLTELLPVSSSAHLNFMPWMLGWEIPESFDLALHIGTLFAIVIYFLKDWLKLIKGGCALALRGKKTQTGRLFWYIVIATVPTGIAALVFDKLKDKLVGDSIDLEMGLIAAALIIMGVILYIVDKKAKSTVTLGELKFKPAFMICLSQVLAAVFPGVSRSGITMTVSRAYGLDRESAARYSFLLSAPMVAAAAVAKIPDFSFDLNFVCGILASFIVGMIVIKFLMSYIKKGSFGIFALYRIAIGLVIFGILIFK